MEPAATSPTGALRATIVVPLYGKAELTRQCVASIFEVGLPPDVELVLVDNASPDDTAAACADFERQHGTQVRTLRMPRNIDFAGACNVGAREARGSIVVFLNNDTVVTSGWLDTLLDRLADRTVGVVGARLLYPDGTVQHAGVGFADDAIGHHVLVGRGADDPEVVRARDLQAVTAACMAVRRDQFLDFGAFDQAYRNGLEDVDLCLRMRTGGLRVSYEPSCTVYHHESQSHGRFQHAAANIQRYLATWGRRVVPDLHTWNDPRSPRNIGGPAMVLPRDRNRIDVVQIESEPHLINAALAGSDAGAIVLAWPSASASGLDAARALAARCDDVVVLGDGPPESLVGPTPAARVDRTPTIVVVPGEVVDAVGGWDVAIRDASCVLLDFLNRCTAFGYVVLDPQALLPPGRPWRLPVVRSGNAHDLITRRWCIDALDPGATFVHAPLVTTTTPLAEASFDRRGTVVLLSWDADAAQEFERAAQALLGGLSAVSNATVVVHHRGDSRAIEVLERTADEAAPQGGLVDVVDIAEGDDLADAALCAVAQIVAITGVGEPARRLRSLAIAAGAQPVGIDDLLATVLAHLRTAGGVAAA